MNVCKFLNVQRSVCVCVCVCVCVLYQTLQYGSSSVTLLAKSIAALPVEVASVTTVPEDSRIYVKNSWGKLPRLKPNTLNEVRCMAVEKYGGRRVISCPLLSVVVFCIPQLLVGCFCSTSA